MAVYIDSEEVQGEIIYFIECKRCGVYRTPDEAYKSGIDAEGVQMYTENECRYCSTKNEDRVRAYRILVSTEEGRKRFNQSIYDYNERNPEVNKGIQGRRRARKNALPDEMTDEQSARIREHFAVCRMSGSTDLQEEHFIAIATGQGGGHSVQNVTYMDAWINNWKRDSNPFIFFRREDVINEIMSRYNRTRSQVVEGFEYYVEYLAEMNDMAPEQFEDYVNYCYANRKSEEEIEALAENGLTVNSRKEFEDYKAGVTNRQ